MKTMIKRLFSLLAVLALVLSIAPVISLPAAAADTESDTPVRFPSDVESYDAECPVCETTVTWKPYNGENYSEASGTALTGASSAHFHLYLTKDHTYAAGNNFLISYRQVCFNLNGYDITASVGSRATFACSRRMNFIDTYGGSLVTGYNYITDGTGGAAFTANSSTANYHIYGGTWTKLAEDTWSSIARVNTKGGTINLHDGAVIDASGTEVNNTNAGGAVSLAGTTGKAVFNMYGGEIKGGTAITGGSILVGAPDKDNQDLAAFNMYGGTISGGAAENGDNVFINPGASFTMSGGTVASGFTAGTDAKLVLSGDPKILGSGLQLAEGVVADIANLTENASIMIGTSANGAKLTAAREDAATLEDVFTSADGANILLGADNCFYSFSKGVAILDKGNVTFYDTAAEAAAAYYAENGFANGAVLLMGAADQTITLAGDAYVDASGKNVTITGTGKLYGTDSGNDDYKSCAQWTLGENVTVQTDVTSPSSGYRYLFVDGGYHRIDLAITHVTLRPAADPGMYYKARIGCDAVLAKLVAGYGTALSVESMPGADFAERTDVEYTAFDKSDFASLYKDNQVTTNSCILVSILKTDNTEAVNTSNAKHRVYANLYLNLKLDGATVTLLSDEKNPGKTINDTGFDGVACSLRSLIEGMHNNWSKYSVANRSAVRNFVKNWNQYVFEGTFPAIRNDISVGFGRVDITPSYSVPLAGYGNTQNRMSTGVKERIYATCVAITEENGQTLLLIAHDLVSSDWGDETRSAISTVTGVPTENIMLSASHTHAAPDIRSTLDVIQQNYKTDYLNWLVEAAEAAMADRSPAMAYTGSTTLEKMNSVRHYLMSDGTYAGDNFGSFTNKTIVSPAEEADNQMQVIKFAREGKQAVVMTNWQAHVTYGTSSTDTKISSCFVGPARDHFEETTGDLFVYFTGACGNVNPRSRISGENLASSYTEYGEILSQAAIDTTNQMDESHITEFGIKAVTFTGQVNHDMEDKLEQALEVKAVYDTEGTSAANKLAKQYGFSSAYHANGVVRRSAYGQTKDMEISAFHLGDISFVAVPYEMFTAHGMYIKSNTPGTTFVLTSCNNRFGYIPTNLAYDYGCYESHTGDFARGTGDQLASAYVDMLNELSGEPTAEKKQLSLRYDDRYNVSGKTVNILNAGTPTSYKVGTSEKDTAIITLDGDDLIATGIGTAQVKIDSTVYNITVEAAPISLVMITGHSIGAGQNGTPDYSVVGPAGQVYSSHGTQNLDANTAGVGIGYGATVKAKNIDAFTEAGAGTKGEGSGLAWQWNNLTGEKIWVLNTAVGGSCLPEWLPGETYYENAVTQFQRAQAILENEVKAGHYTLSQMGIFYHNGANFSYKNVVATQSDYETWYEAMWNGFKSETSRDMDGNGKSEAVSFLGLVPIWTISGGISYSSDEPAGLYMAASKDYPEIFTASLIGQNWLTDANVAEKFPEINYTMQASGDYQRPNLTVDVFASDNVHYQQVAYNALGIDIANNLYAWLNAEDNNPELVIYNTSLMLDLTDTLELTVGEAWVLSPVTNLNDLTFTASGCIELKYPLQVVAIGEGTGTLTISNGSFTKEITFICKNPSDNP